MHVVTNFLRFKELISNLNIDLQHKSVKALEAELSLSAFVPLIVNSLIESINYTLGENQITLRFCDDNGELVTYYQLKLK
jgi:hypothetical protein